MEKQGTHIGQIIDRYEWALPLDAAEKYARAAKQHPHFSKKSGYKIVTNYFSATIQLAETLKKLKVDETQIMHTKENIQLFSSPNPADKLTIFVLCKDLYEQQGQNCPIGFAEIQFCGLKGRKPIFIAERTLAIRGGFKR